MRPADSTPDTTDPKRTDPASGIVRRGSGAPPLPVPARHVLRRAAGFTAAVATVLLVAGAWWIAGELREAERRVAGLGARRAEQPTRLYGRPLTLEVGRRFPRHELIALLDDLQYHEVGHGPPVSGTYVRRDGGLALRTRGFPSPHAGSRRPEADLWIAWRGGVVGEITVDGTARRRAVVDLPLLATLYGPSVRECRPVMLDELPDEVVRAFLAAEDSGFFEHRGVSPAGVLRAAWVNLRRGDWRQGGSTLTQQLVKNLFLTHERTLARKFREALLAWALERRVSKERILESYLNEIYLGASGSANLIGVGAAARAYFGKDTRELELAEAATLAAMVAAPGRFDPRLDPAPVGDRRDRVLREMASLGWISEARAADAIATPLTLRPTHPTRRLAPYFTAAAIAEARERFGVTTLAGKGLALFTTLDLRDQRRAESTVDEQLTALERGRDAGERLEAALVSADPASGALLAWVGGRDWARSQFDRVRQARRSPGSAFKPVVYAAALEAGVVQPWHVVEDGPVIVRYGDRSWEPRNNDRDFRGPVTVRRAFEQSLNVPTVRVALAAGLDRVARLAERMGATDGVADGAQPSLSLGAVGLSPLELASIYTTLATGGVSRELHGLESVPGPDGRPLDGPLDRPLRVLHETTAFQVTSLLRGVIDRGTGFGVRRAGLRDPLAGKTGTSSGRRDAWFAGYSADRVTVVWVGRDDDRPTGLDGGRGALPAWAAFMDAVRPAAGYPEFEPPPMMEIVEVDPDTGLLATEHCPRRVDEPVLAWQAPDRWCGCAAPLMATGADLPPGTALVDGRRIRVEQAGLAAEPEVLMVGALGLAVPMVSGLP